MSNTANMMMAVDIAGDKMIAENTGSTWTSGLSFWVSEWKYFNVKIELIPLSSMMDVEKTKIQSIIFLIIILSFQF